VEPIRLRPNLSLAEEFSVLTHELAHEMLHHGSDRAQLPKVVRETQAEAVAYVVSRGIGLETGSAAADYIALYNGDDRTLADSLAAVQATSSKILNALLPREPEHPERASAARPLEKPGGMERGHDNPPPGRAPAGPEPNDGISLER
jgi:hypothetical protein